MDVHVVVSPSKDARQLFGQLVARSDDTLTVPLAAVLALNVERARQGFDPQADEEMQELVKEQWIERGEEGSWAVRGLVL